MSISEQVKELREFEIGWLHDVPMAKGIMKQAADTIEALSAKLAAANTERSDRYYGGGWIACEDRLPDGGGMYIVTAVENGLYHTTFAKWQPRYKDWDLRGCRSHWKVIAWQPLPEPYHP